MDRYMVISSDCHAGLPPEQYRDYLDPEYRELFDDALPIQMEMIRTAEKRFLIQEINDEWRRGIEKGLTGAWDPVERTKMLDGDGITAEIIFPDGITEMNTPPFGAGLGLPTEGVDPTLQWAGARAHNRWLAELCSGDPVRRLGLAIVPVLWDIDQAVEEVRWAHENGLRGVLIPHMTTGKDPYHHPKYDPFWEVCEALNMVISFHSGGAPQKDYFGDTWPVEGDVDLPGAMGIYISEVHWWSYRPLAFLIWGGVFERFPKLKVTVTESGCNWVPSFMERQDFFYSQIHFAAKLGDFRSHLSMKPSDYMRRNVAVGSSCMPRQEAEQIIGENSKLIMWGSDYPHPEGSWPNTGSQLIEVFSGLPDDEVAGMLGTNAAKFFDLDLGKLNAIAARVGPEKSSFR